LEKNYFQKLKEKVEWIIAEWTEVKCKKAFEMPLLRKKKTK
jgi:hypothetical protein